MKARPNGKAKNTIPKGGKGTKSPRHNGPHTLVRQLAPAPQAMPSSKIFSTNLTLHGEIGKNGENKTTVFTVTLLPWSTIAIQIVPRQEMTITLPSSSLNPS